MECTGCTLCRLHGGLHGLLVLVHLLKFADWKWDIYHIQYTIVYNILYLKTGPVQGREGG